MVRIRKHKKVLFMSSVSCLLLLAAFFAGCATLKEQSESATNEPIYGQISLFLNGPDKASVDLTFELDAVIIEKEDGTTKEVMNTPLIINSGAMVGQQIVLGERTVPEGTYKKIRFIVKEASINSKGKPASLALPPEGIVVDTTFTVNKGQSTALFVEWNAAASVVEGYMFRPVFYVKGQTPEVSSLLIYVTNEDSDNVSVINRQSGDIVATIKVGKSPKGIAMGLSQSNQRIYVANSGSNSISVIDPTTNKVVTEIPLRFGWGPEGIAVAMASSDRELIYVTNYSSNTVSVVDGTTYQEIDKINVGNGPIAIAADPPVAGFLNSTFLSFANLQFLTNYRSKYFNVYIANQNSKNITVASIDMSTGSSSSVQPPFNVSVDWNPIALGIDYQRGKLYVTNHDSDKLSVLDIPTLSMGGTSGGLVTINNVGFSGIGVVPDSTFDRVYLLRDTPGAVVVLKTPLSGLNTSAATVVTPIIDVVSVGDSPRALVLDPEGRKLYVVNRGSNNISVIDKTTRKVERTIPAGSKPYGIAVFTPVF